MKIEDLENIQKVVSENRLVYDRIKKLIEMGYTVKECPMGFGRVLQVREMKRETRIQISTGNGKYNYAYSVIIKK